MKKRRWLKITGIFVVSVIISLAVAAGGVYSYLKTRFGGNPNVILAADESTEVEITGGKISGGLDEGIYTYLGVPYAEAKEWFVPASQVEPWEGVREYKEYGSMSPQSSFFGSDGQDNNCQNLNIWTPALNDGGKRPVMVWLHGGGFSTGTANQTETDGRNLAQEEDVVVVSVNHRLGVAGYLNLSTYGEKYQYSGNVGMMDVIDALQWIQDNIEVFGGDASNVTVFGQSGGGAKVLTLMTSPYAEGLFQKGIIQSGATDTVGPVLTSNEVSQRITELVLKKLNITEENIEDLQAVSFSDLNDAGTQALQQVAEEYKIESPFGGSYSYEWMPVVDGDFLPTNPVTEEGFAEAGADVPILIGSNLNEWETMFGDGNTVRSDEEVLSELRERYGDTAEDILGAFKEAYPDKDIVNVLYTDSMLRIPLLRIMAHKADQNGAPVYSYLFTYGAPQCTHGAEIPYVFGNVSGDDEGNEKMEQTMRSIWASFAHTGEPGLDGMPEWPAYTRDSGATMILDAEPAVGYHHDEKLLGLLEPDFEY